MEQEQKYVSKRPKFNEHTPFHDLMVKICEGNPGTAQVVGRIIETTRKGEAGPVQKPEPVLLALIDMNVRGSQIWVGWKDHCHGDTARFIDLVMKRDEDLVKTINENCYHPELNRKGYNELAVQRGWSS